MSLNHTKYMFPPPVTKPLKSCQRHNKVNKLENRERGLFYDQWNYL